MNYTHTLIHNLHGEKFAITTRVAPGADATLVGHTGANGPPMGQREDSSFSSFVFWLLVVLQRITKISVLENVADACFFVFWS